MARARHFFSSINPSAFFSLPKISQKLHQFIFLSLHLSNFLSNLLLVCEVSSKARLELFYVQKKIEKKEITKFENNIFLLISTHSHSYREINDFIYI